MSTESFLAIWQSQYKFLTNEFLLKKSVYAHGLYGNDSVLGQAFFRQQQAYVAQITNVTGFAKCWMVCMVN